MTKKKKTPIGIFAEAVKLYFSNFNQFVKYMTFPVLGQIAGIIITLTCVLIYSRNLPNLIERYKIFNDFNTLVLTSVLIAIPGMIILLKAFWEYLVAYGAVNSMLDNMLKSGKVYDFNAHTELIKRRTASFVTLWLILGFFILLAYCPLLWIPAGVISIYLVLVFQTFTYEPELTPIGCIKQSFNLIKGHFGSTFLLMLFSGLICWALIPQIFNYIFDISGINKLLGLLIMPFVAELPISEINTIFIQFSIPIIKNEDVAIFILNTTIAQIFIQYTLPLRSILCGLWYKELNNLLPENKEKKKSSKKRPSEKLMEESHKKFVKKLDINILKRATEKDSDLE